VSAGKVLRYVALTLLALLFVSPLLFMITTSFKTRIESAQTPPSLIPSQPTLNAYEQILTAADTPVFRWFLNSMVAATANAALVVATAALAA
jgi:multiple sugar transport system permease protein